MERAKIPTESKERAHPGQGPQKKKQSLTIDVFFGFTCIKRLPFYPPNGKFLRCWAKNAHFPIFDRCQ